MNSGDRKGETLVILALAVLLILGSFTVQGFPQMSPWERGAPEMTGMDALPCPLTYDGKPGFTSTSCKGACKTYEDCSQDKSFPACYHCVSKCGPGSFFNDASCGGYGCDYTKSGNAHCYKTKDLAEGPCFSCVECDKGDFIEDPSCKGLCKNGQKCKAAPSLWDNPETGKKTLCYSCMFDECPEGSWPAHLCSSKCGKDETCDYIGLAGSSKGEYTSHNCVRCRKVSCPSGFFAHPLTCAPWNCPEGDCERSSVSRGLFSKESDTCYKCVPRCAKGQFTELSFCETKCQESGRDCLPTTYPSAVEVPGKACFECRCRSYKGLFDSMDKCQHNCEGKCSPEKTQYVERNSCIECNKCPVGSTLDANCKTACKGTCTPLIERPECSKCVLKAKQMRGKCPEGEKDSPNCYFSCTKPDSCLEDPRIKGCYYCGKNLFEGVGGDMYGGDVLHLPEGGTRNSGTLTVPMDGTNAHPPSSLRKGDFSRGGEALLLREGVVSKPPAQDVGLGSNDNCPPGRFPMQRCSTECREDQMCTEDQLFPGCYSCRNKPPIRIPNSPCPPEKYTISNCNNKCRMDQDCKPDSTIKGCFGCEARPEVTIDGHQCSPGFVASKTCYNSCRPYQICEEDPMAPGCYTCERRIPLSESSTPPCAIGLFYDKNCAGSCKPNEVCGEAGSGHSCFYCYQKSAENSIIPGSSHPPQQLSCPEGFYMDNSCRHRCIEGFECTSSSRNPGCFMCLQSPKKISLQTGTDRCIDVNHDGNPDQCTDGNGDGTIDPSVLRSFGWRVLGSSPTKDGNTLNVKTKDGSLITVNINNANGKSYVRIDAGFGSPSESSGYSAGYSPGSTIHSPETSSKTSSEPADESLPSSLNPAPSPPSTVPSTGSSPPATVSPPHSIVSPPSSIVTPPFSLPVSCQEKCSAQAMTTAYPNYRDFLESQLSGVSCVKGVSVSSPRSVRIGDCTCYDTNPPQITIDRTPPVCSSRCGDVPCGSEYSCSCGDHCELFVSCKWRGWFFTSSSATPSFGSISYSE